MKPVNHQKPWTATDDALLISMIPHNIPTEKIAEHLGRTPATIVWRTWYLRRHQKLDVTTSLDTEQQTLWTENDHQFEPDQDTATESKTANLPHGWTYHPNEKLPDDDSFMNAEMPAEMSFLDGVRGRPLPQPTAIIRRSILWGLIKWTRFVYDHGK